MRSSVGLKRFGAAVGLAVWLFAYPALGQTSRPKDVARYDCAGHTCKATAEGSLPEKRFYELLELPYYRTTDQGLDDLCDVSSIQFSPDGQWLAFIRDHIDHRPPSAGYRVGGGVLLGRVSCLFGPDPGLCRQIRLASPAMVRTVWFSDTGETLFVSDGGGQRLSAWSLADLWSLAKEPNRGVRLIDGAVRPVGFSVEGDAPRAPIFQVEGPTSNRELEPEVRRLEDALREAEAWASKDLAVETVALRPSGLYGATFQRPGDLSLWVRGSSALRVSRTRFGRPYWNHVGLYQGRGELVVSSGAGAVERLGVPEDLEPYWRRPSQVATDPASGRIGALYSETGFRSLTTAIEPKIDGGIWRYAMGPGGRQAVWIELPPLEGARIHFLGSGRDAAFDCLPKSAELDDRRPITRRLIQLPGRNGGTPARLYEPSGKGRGLAIYMHGGPAANLDYDDSHVVRSLVSQGYTVLAPEFIGSMGRDWRRNIALSKQGIAGVDADAEAIARWVRKRGRNRALFVGNSYGAAYYLPLARQGVISRGILVGPWLKWRDPAEWLSSVGEIRTRELSYGDKRNRNVFGVAGGDTALSLKRVLPWTAEDCAALPPTLAIFGERDPFSKPQDVAACKARLQLKVLAGRGHEGLWPVDDADLLEFLLP